MGQLGLAPSVLYGLTFAEFNNAVTGFFELEKERDQREWERTRWLACLLLNPHTKKRLKPEDIAEFPWEAKRKPAADGLAILRQIAKSSNG